MSLTGKRQPRAPSCGGCDKESQASGHMLKGEYSGSQEQGEHVQVTQGVDPGKKCSNENSSSTKAAGFSAPVSHLVIMPLCTNGAVLKKEIPAVCLSKNKVLQCWLWILSGKTGFSIMHVGKLSSALAI